MKEEKKKKVKYQKIDIRDKHFISVNLLETWKVFKYGKIWPRSHTNFCARDQRMISRKIKFMINLGLLPACSRHTNAY